MSEASLTSLLGRMALQPVGAPIEALATAARARHGASVGGVLFYGSCLRGGELEGKVVDFYLLVDRYRDALGSRLSAFFNAALPPNVYYLECEHQGTTLRAKYAVISLDDFEAGAARWLHPYIWARFAQPCRLAYVRDEASRARIVEALSAAARTVVRQSLPLLPASFALADLWVGAFRQTYRTELRAERVGRADDLFAADSEHYAAVTAGLVEEGILATDGTAPTARLRAAQANGGRRGAEAKWWLRRVQGKLLSVLRLIKAAFTFSGGPRYLLWKIERHSGVTVTLTPWQEQHPILASTVIFWRLYSKGAFK